MSVENNDKMLQLKSPVLLDQNRVLSIELLIMQFTIIAFLS